MGAGDKVTIIIGRLVSSYVETDTPLCCTFVRVLEKDKDAATFSRLDVMAILLSYLCRPVGYFLDSAEEKGKKKYSRLRARAIIIGRLGCVSMLHTGRLPHLDCNTSLLATHFTYYYSSLLVPFQSFIVVLTNTVPYYLYSLSETGMCARD